MKTALLVLGLLLTGIYSQTCGTSALTPAKAPVTEKDCNSATTAMSECCYLEISTNSVTAKTCLVLSIDTPYEKFKSDVSKLYANSQVVIKCSATSISVGMILIALLALLFF